MKNRALALVAALTLFVAGAMQYAVAQSGAVGSGPAPGARKAPLSPPAEASTVLNGRRVTIAYSAPSVRGRVIFGGLQPYGEVWRLGANAATTLTTETDLKLGTLTLPAGKYTLYALPEDGKPSLLIVNKQTGQWGTVYDAAQDLGRTPWTAAKLSAPQETMSLSFENVQGKSAELHMKWATSDWMVKLTAQ